MKHVASGALILVLSVWALAADAQEGIPHAREGFVFGLAAGWGNAGADLPAVEKVDRENGVVGDLTLGWAVRPDIVLNLEFDIWSQLFGDVEWYFNLNSVGITYFPLGKSAYATASLGVGTSRVEAAGSGGSTVRQDRAGVGFAVAGGYEWWIHEEVALGPKVKWTYLDPGGDLTTHADYFSIAVQLTWYKPRSKA